MANIFRLAMCQNFMPAAKRKLLLFKFEFRKMMCAVRLGFNLFRLIKEEQRRKVSSTIVDASKPVECVTVNPLTHV